jgi:hypothetical protein
VKRRDHVLALFQEQGLGDFELQALGRQAGLLERVGDAGEQVADAELGRGQVDGHADVVGPGGGIGAGPAQDQRTDRIDQTGLLCHRNEFSRRDHAPFRIGPAHQGLEPCDPAGAQVDQRLIVRPQHATVDCRPQLGLDPPPLLGAGVHAFFEEAVVPPRLPFGARQRHIGVLEQPLGIVAVARRQRDADARLDHDRLLLQHIGPADDVEQTLGQQYGVLEASELRLNDGEFVGPQSGDDVLLAQ